MSKRIAYFSLLFLLITAGIFAILKMGYEPQPVSVMGASYFEKPEQIGAVVYRRFYAAIEQRRIVLFGIPPQPEFHRDVVRGFLTAANKENRPFEVIASEPQMPPLDLSGLPPMEQVSLEFNAAPGTQAETEFIDRLRSLRVAGKRTLIYLPSVFSTHLLPMNPVLRYESATGERLFSISTGPIALKADQEYVVEPVCIGEQVDGMGLAPLGCAEMRAGRALYRKHLPQDRYVGVMNEQRPEDYLLMISYPGQDKAETPVPTPPAKAASL